MSSIAGIYRKNGQVVTAEEMATVMDGLDHWNPDTKEQLVEGAVGMGQLMLFNTPESRYEQLPFKDPESGLLITSDARIDNRQELLDALDIEIPGQEPVTDSQLILEAYKKYGVRCTDLLVGAFAFVIFDIKKNKLFLARDHMGFRPLFYYENNDLFLFATEIKGIKVHPAPRLTVDELFVADALSTIRSEKERTFYREIRRLPPAHQIVITTQKSSLKRYWKLNPHYELKLPSEEAYVEAFREKLKDAVHCRLRSDYPVGAELSGGIDSSTIVSIAAQKGNIKTFSHALPDWAKDKVFPYDDETSHSRRVIKYHGIRDHFFVTGEKEGILKALKNGVKLHEGVMQGTLSEVFEPLYQKAIEERCRTLLSGYGGDEMVTSPGPGYLQELAARFRLLKLIREIYRKNQSKRNGSTTKSGKRINFLRTLKSFVKAMIDGQLQRFRPKYRTPAWAHDIYHALAIDDGFMKEVSLKERFYSKKKLPSSGSTRMRQYRRINYDYVPQRLEYCAIKAQTYRMEYRHPLLDKRLIEFYLSLPARMKVQNGYGRYILRKATEGILPPEIQWRTDKTGTVVPSIFIRMKQDQEAIRELIEKARNSHIKHYVDYDRMLDMLERILNRDTDSTERINPQAFQSSLMLLMYQLDQLEKNEAERAEKTS